MPAGLRPGIVVLDKAAFIDPPLCYILGLEIVVRLRVHGGTATDFAPGLHPLLVSLHEPVEDEARLIAQCIHQPSVFPPQERDFEWNDF